MTTTTMILFMIDISLSTIASLHKLICPFPLKILICFGRRLLKSYCYLSCSKDLANFHRPKALWYPHDNEVAAKEQGKLSTQGPMKVIIKTMGGKGSKLHVDAEETVSSVKSKASKKLG